MFTLFTFRFTRLRRKPRTLAVDECEKGISPKSRVNGTKADVLRRVFAEAGAGATDFSPRGGSTLLRLKARGFHHPRWGH
jgi:hypothetical protein